MTTTNPGPPATLRTTSVRSIHCVSPGISSSSASTLAAARYRSNSTLVLAPSLQPRVVIPTHLDHSTPQHAQSLVLLPALPPPVPHHPPTPVVTLLTVQPQPKPSPVSIRISIRHHHPPTSPGQVHLLPRISHASIVIQIPSLPCIPPMGLRPPR